jgi:hypothetical protein
MPDNPKDALPLYFVDEAAIVAQNDAAVLADIVLQKHVQMINRSLDFIDRALRSHVHRSDDELMVHRLAIRCLNSGAAALRLARCGYYNQGLSLVRDIMETMLLLDLFARERALVTQWRTASAAEREKNFGPVKVRLRLEELDTKNGNEPFRRNLTYKRLSTYGAHASPEGFALISPNMMTQIGPFPDAARMKALVEEIVQHLTFAALIFGGHLPKNIVGGMHMKLEFYDQVGRWQKELMPPSSGSSEP